MAQSPEFMLSRHFMAAYDFDPGGTSLVDVKWIDIEDPCFTHFAMGFIRTIGTSATVFKIIGNTVGDGSGTDIVLATHAVGSEPDAVGDNLWLEASADMAAGDSIKAISAQVSVATGTDEAVVVYVFRSQQPKTGRTADIIA